MECVLMDMYYYSACSLSLKIQAELFSEKSGLHDVTSQKMEVCVVTTVRTSYL
jgi:hypothetical protein